MPLSAHILPSRSVDKEDSFKGDVESKDKYAANVGIAYFAQKRSPIAMRKKEVTPVKLAAP
jgi:hypothetical protein